MSEDSSIRRLVAIMVADVVGYSRLMGIDETGTLARLTALRQTLIEPQVSAYGGHIVKLMGDGILATFPSIVDALACAVEVQRALAKIEDNIVESQRIQFRIGIHLGDVLVQDDDIYGDGVNIAARLEGLAEPGGICISNAVKSAIGKKLDLDYEDFGKQEVKHISEPVHIYKIVIDKKASPVAASEPIATELADKPSIAVLPFNNMSGDAEQAYFADGITEDIITELSKLSGLLVISRNSTFTYKGKVSKVREICRDLGVRYLLEGSVRKAGQRVRISAQLIDGISDGHLWAERYDRDLAEIFAVQDDVTERIVRALEVNLLANEKDRSARVETDNPDAYDCVLRGREQYRLFSKDGNCNARRLYAKAIELDPNYAAAYAGLAETCMHDWFLGSPDALDRAYELALQAHALNPSLPLVFEALGNVHLFKKQHKEAIAAARQWINIEPSNADAYANLAGTLHFSGQPEQAIPLIEKAVRLNPFYPFYYILYKGQAYLTMECYEEALKALKRSVTHNPEALPAHIYLAACFGLLGDGVAARKALTEAYRIYPDFSIAWVLTFLPYKHTADSDRLLKGLRMAGLPD